MGAKFEFCPVTASISIDSESDPNYDLLNVKINAHSIYMNNLVHEIDQFIENCTLLMEYVKSNIKSKYKLLNEETIDVGIQELLNRSFLPNLCDVVDFDTYIK
jgi:hypothetical protein